MKRKWFLVVITVSLMFPFLRALADPPVTFEVFDTFEYPGSLVTILGGINDEGDAAGYWNDISNTYYGFIHFPNSLSGLITEPNDKSHTTTVWDINDQGTVCGNYGRTDGHSYSFTASNGIFTEVPSVAVDTFVRGLNNAGNMCGFTTNPGGAFVIIDGTVISFTIPGADAVFPFDINNLNQCVGYYQVGGAAFSFRREADGTLIYPIQRPRTTNTILTGINDNGVMVGSVHGHAILFQSLGDSVYYDYPDSSSTFFTGINNRGQITGYYYTRSGQRNFIARVKPVAGAD